MGREAWDPGTQFKCLRQESMWGPMRGPEQSPVLRYAVDVQVVLGEAAEIAAQGAQNGRVRRWVYMESSKVPSALGGAANGGGSSWSSS